MSDIEWQGSSELQPENALIGDFCREHGLDWRSLPGSSLPLVFIDRRALEALHEFLGHDLRREHGGVLVGRPYYDAGMNRYFVVIQAAIPAQETEGSPVHLQFTSETWAYISGIIEEAHPDKVIVGWYHSHPRLGVFMSATDRATQSAFYHHPWSLAVVVDPVIQHTGWFAGAQCAELGRQQVIPYEPMAAPRQAGVEVLDVSEYEEEYLAQYSLERLRWLLPLGMIFLSLFLFVWWLGKNRLA
ncbi:MAG: Mov34/MPN/PAD-1 family protein [Anaerolineales bacterium]|nr:Mov34/MPN/PAD-1 family protein [Anaerolineales bacterium]